jgi:hypothetical protein
MDQATLAGIVTSVYSKLDDKDYYTERAKETEADKRGRIISER